jgi:hypothetical protein
VATTVATPIVIALVIGLASSDHRGPCALALVLAVVPLLLLRARPSVVHPGRRFGLEAAAYTSVGSWLAVALWAVLDHHR